MQWEPPDQTGGSFSHFWVTLGGEPRPQTGRASSFRSTYLMPGSRM